MCNIPRSSGARKYRRRSARVTSATKFCSIVDNNDDTDFDTDEAPTSDTFTPNDG
eukprot:gene3905-2772_t